MTLFGFAVIFAGLSANDPLITAAGIVIALAGLVVFVFRQITHEEDKGEAGVTAGIVSIKAPASIVMIVVGVFIILVGRGALTLDVDDVTGSDDAAAPVPPPTTLPPTTTTTTAPTTTTTVPPTTPPPTTTPPGEVEPPMTELPYTGGGVEMLGLGLTILAGGRWVLQSQDGGSNQGLS